MVRAEKTVDISENPGVLGLAEDVQSSGEAALLQRDGKPIARLVPVETKPKRRTRLPKGKPMSFDDPLWKLIGTGSSGGSNVGELKHEYIAQAIKKNKGI